MSGLAQKMCVQSSAIPNLKLSFFLPPSRGVKYAFDLSLEYSISIQVLFPCCGMVYIPFTRIFYPD